MSAILLDSSGRLRLSNPTLADGTVGRETDTGLLKIGDGSTAWNDLAYEPDTTTGPLQTLENSIGEGGGSQPGAAIVRAFPFTFDTPNLLTGASIGYTPNVGDILLDAWFEVDTAWDGTNPLADIGMFLDGDDRGYFYNGYDTIPMGNPDIHHGTLSNGYLTGTSINGAGVGYTYALAELNRLADQGREGSPGKFTEVFPICVCVSQNGRPIGADPGSTQGAAILYLVTATPVVLL